MAADLFTNTQDADLELLFAAGWQRTGKKALTEQDGREWLYEMWLDPYSGHLFTFQQALKTAKQRKEAKK